MEFHAYIAPTGQILPNTIREREGDAESALRSGGAKYRYDLSKCKKVRVRVEVVPVTFEEYRAEELSKPLP